MTGHPERDELLAFRERRLPAAGMLRVDAHLTGCAECRARLGVGNGAARRVVQHVVASGAHLSFEQLEAMVDARVDPAQRATIEAHVAWCAQCRHELDDLTQAAASLRQRVPAKPAPRRWFAGSGSWLPSLALASLVAVVALGVLLPDRGPSSGGEMRIESSPVDEAALDARFDHSALQQLDRLSPEAARALSARDYAAVLRELRPRAERRDPLALAALASMYARGYGVQRDLQQAEQLWQRAADRGHAPSRANLELLRRLRAAQPPSAPRF